MNFKYLTAAIIVSLMMVTTANASLYNFSQTGFEEGATISGSFEGTDINSNGLIQQDGYPLKAGQLLKTEGYE